MEVKGNIQKRREDRLRELRGLSARREAPPASAAEPGSANELLLWSEESHDEGHGGDPELAWRQKERQLLLQWGEDRSGTWSGGVPQVQAGQNGGMSGRGGGSGPLRKLMMLKTVIAFVLFVVICVGFQLDMPWTKEGRRLVSDALTTDMDFSRAAAWYGKLFSGAPSLLPAFGGKGEAAKVQGRAVASSFVQPVKGTAAGQYADDREGIWIRTRTRAQVAAVDAGRVEFAGVREDTGYTVIIRHAGGYRTTYGGLDPAQWEAGDWLSAGQVIGEAGTGDDGEGALFFAIMKDGRYVNPLDVVSID